jgi:hypothetical protein
LYSGYPASSSSLKASLILVKNFSNEKEASFFQNSVSNFVVADAARAYHVLHQCSVHGVTNERRDHRHHSPSQTMFHPLSL